MRHDFKRRRVSDWCTCGVSFATACALCVFLWLHQRTPLITDVSVRIADTSDWEQCSPFGPFDFEPCWLSDREVLFVKAEDIERHIPKAYRVLDTATVRMRNCVQLTRNLGSSIIHGRLQSPDGRWLLLNGEETDRLVELNRTRIEKLRGFGGTEVWTPDSSTLIRFERSDGTQDLIASASITPVASPGAARHIPVLSRVPFYGINDIMCNGREFIVIADAFPSGSPQSRRAVDLYHTGLSIYPKSEIKTTITLPPGYEAEETRLSPDGSKLSLLCYVRQDPPFASLFERILHRPAVQPQNNIIVCVYDIRRGTLQALGATGPKTSPAEIEQLYGLRWSPSGRFLSFFYQDSLWRLPVR
jgi:hypothetical protein